MKNLILPLLVSISCFAFGQNEPSSKIPHRPPPTEPSPCETFRETLPFFPGCDEPDLAEKKRCAELKFLEFIYGNLEKDDGLSTIEGLVVIGFTIEKDGAISNAKIVRDIGGGAGEEALRVVNLMPRWEPGTQCGRPVRVQYNLPVRFRIE